MKAFYVSVCVLALLVSSAPTGQAQGRSSQSVPDFSFAIEGRIYTRPYVAGKVYIVTDSKGNEIFIGVREEGWVIRQGGSQGYPTSTGTKNMIGEVHSCRNGKKFIRWRGLMAWNKGAEEKDFCR